MPGFVSNLGRLATPRFVNIAIQTTCWIQLNRPIKMQLPYLRCAKGVRWNCVTSRLKSQRLKLIVLLRDFRIAPRLGRRHRRCADEEKVANRSNRV